MHELVEEQAQVTTIGRFQALQAGQYWKATGNVPEQGISLGMVLLIQSIRWVDEKPHTVVLRPHPSLIGTRVEIEVPDEDGETEIHAVHYNEHRFLLEDFLKSFEFEPDHQRIRAEELNGLQARIQALQSELVATQANPVLLAAVVEAGLRAADDSGVGRASDHRGEVGEAEFVPSELKGETHGHGASALPATVAHGAEMAVGTIGDALRLGVTPDRIEAMKGAAQREHQIATIKGKWIQRKTTEIAVAIKQMTPYYEEQAAAALALTEDVRSYVAKLLQGIESLDLYIGKNVEVQGVREGESASRGVPLTFVQRKLMMDEELAVWADVDERFDFESEERFFEALRAHDDLVRQIFPTDRCVLVMAVTRRYIDYGDNWASSAKNDENRKVFLLVRDGWNIHRVFSPVESHLGAQRLFPTQNDQDKVFQGLDGTRIKFEDVAYTDRLAAHDGFALHYKRFLLLVCGLDHRLKLFGEFYEGPPTMEFVSMDFQAMHCRFLHDDDESRLLPGEDRPSVRDWVKGMNKYLGSGSRVLCQWRSLMNPDTAPGACKETNERHNRRGFTFRAKPVAAYAVTVAYREGHDVCVDAEVSRYSPSEDDDVTFKCKVNLSRWVDGKWDWDADLAFLCMDAVDPEALRWYIHNRGTRRNHLEYLRFFKRALKYVESERAQEAETRAALLRALIDGRIGAESQREVLVNQALVAWRAAHRGKPAPSPGDASRTAWKSLLDQMYLLAGEGSKGAAVAAQMISAQGWEPLRVVLSGGARIYTYAAPRAEERDDRLVPHAWVHRVAIGGSSSRPTAETRKWATLPMESASETTLLQFEAASQWIGKSSVFTTMDSKTRLLGRAEGYAAAISPYLATMNEWQHAHDLERWLDARTELTRKSEVVVTPMLAVPIGAVYYPMAKEASYVCLYHDAPAALLTRVAPSEASRRKVREAHLRAYADKVKGAEDLRRWLRTGNRWGLATVPMPLSDGEPAALAHRSLGTEIYPLTGQGHSPLLRDWYAAWRQKNGRSCEVWMADGVLDRDGNLTLDELLGNALPDDYAPRFAFEVQLRDTSTRSPYDRWIDLVPMTDEEHAAFTGEVLARHNQTREISGWSVGSEILLSEREAREAVAERVVRSDGAIVRAALAADLPDAPTPPPGVERWYLLQA